uniref:Derlin n=1 Tax=Lotharella globosa TaxID=91324 RepID=A0A6U2XJX8_9EUKA|mmetsp:Transcript_3185/g.6268  ORF Transcript_3185/g.6268 Transcript_3185/m.6268 type:complete len:237 (+) Transcript_3185:17-727(+)
MSLEQVEQWIREIPPITRTYMIGAFLTTAACALELVSPFSLYFSATLIFTKFQFWRLITNFFFFGGSFSLDFLFHMFFLVRYSKQLEENAFRGKTADFFYFILVGATLMTLLAPFMKLYFLGSSLTFMMVYLWGRRNPYSRMNFLGLFPFTAPYLPWVLLSFSVLLGNNGTVDILGIFVGHLYYFLEDVYPRMINTRYRILKTPQFLEHLFASDEADLAAYDDDGEDADNDGEGAG